MKTTAAHQQGFTLPELLVVCFLVVLLLITGIAYAHPKDYGKERRDAERWNGTARMVQLIGRYVRGHGALPDGITDKDQIIGSDTGMLDLCPSLSPAYTNVMPMDPIDGVGNVTEAICDARAGIYITGYVIKKTGDKAVKVTAPLAEGGQEISVSKKF